MATLKQAMHDPRAALPSRKAAARAGAAPRDGPVPAPADIIDIRGAAVEISLKDDILALFFADDAPRRLPTLLLYDEKGLQLFEEITYLDEYYLTNAEIELLGTSARAMADGIPSGAMVIELGSGNLRKVRLLLQALEEAGKQIDYYALDLSREELKRTLAQVPDWTNVRCHGLLGTYDDGRDWLIKAEHAARPKCILHLGSSIGNFAPQEAAAFLKGFADVLSPGDKMLIGLDACSDPAKVYHAYNDREGLTHKFILNGLTHANRVLGERLFDERDWRVVGEYVCDAQGARHQAFYAPWHDTRVRGALVRPHDRIHVESSFKFAPDEASALWAAAGMAELDHWLVRGEYGLHMLVKPNMAFSLAPAVYARAPLPSAAGWEALWRHWDTVTRQMLPHAELLSKPIKLRNACVFYLGHIPNFVDVQLSKATGEPLTEPAAYRDIFERGIDPDVDNPELCHAHSEIPAEWPPVADILAYQARVRARVRRMYGEDGSAQPKIPRAVARAVWVGFEHEIMHIETLLYMMLQSDRTEPPAGVERPAFGRMAKEALAKRVANRWFDMPAQEITVGMDDPEGGVDADVYFGWDSEKPSRKVQVQAFQAKGRPITNEEYAEYMFKKNITTMPASWTLKAASEHRNGGGDSNGHAADAAEHRPSHAPMPESFLQDKAVRTVFGPVPLRLALDWPVFASYDELAGCAAWMGGRIPTADEARAIYAHAEDLTRRRRAEAEKRLGQTVPAVNGHLSNNGVEETPPAMPDSNSGGAFPSDAFATPDRNGAAGHRHGGAPASVALVPATPKSAPSSPPAKADSASNGTAATSKTTTATGSTDAAALFVDLDGDGANVGFRHWHPTAVTHRGDRLAGHAGMGGVWEWTSTVLVPHAGFAPMSLYPGYTADFFDGKHNVVLGGSWATHPLIAGRRSFVNWYQRNYPYAWAGARVVRDAE